MNRNGDVTWLQITAGQGPKECGWVVAQVYKKIVQDAHTISNQTPKTDVQMVENLPYEKALRKQDIIESDAYRSILLRISGGKSDSFARNWAGTIRWQGASQYRPKHKRINWFVGVALIQPPKNQQMLLQDLKHEVVFETMRSSGPGGQHVNKTESAVRIKHVPTGLSVKIEAERSQHRNKQIAMERLQFLLQTEHSQKQAEIDQHRWLSHYKVQRGNAHRTFKNSNFSEVHH